MKKEFFDAVWTLVGTTVGAGILSLPYVFYKAGFLTGLFVMIITGLIMLVVTLYLGEIVLRTKGKHQLSGLTGIYLGKKGKVVMFIANLLSIYGALTAYIIASGQTLAAIFGGNTLIYSIIFFIVLSIIIYFSISILEKFESLFSPLKIIISLILSFLLIRFIDFSNLSGFNLTNILVPYGALIFAFTGISAVPEINEELKNKRLMLYSIIVGMLITLVIYFLFVFSTVGAVSQVNEVATISLSGFGKGINIFANLFALFAMATAFVALGFALKDNLTLDFKVKNFPSWLIVISVPLLLSLTKFLGFAKLIELSGAVAIGIMLLIILFIHSKAKQKGNRNPEYQLSDNKILKILLAIIIIIGIVYSIVGIL